MHDTCSLKSKLSYNHSWFILFIQRRNSVKKWQQKSNNPFFTQNIWIQVLKIKFCIFEDCSTKNPFFQTKFLDSGQKNGFLDFLGFFLEIFLDASKGCLDFWFSKSKIQKKSRKKMDFSQKRKKPKEKDGFFSKIRKNEGKHWIFARIYLFNFFGFLTFHPFEKNKKIPPKKTQEIQQSIFLTSIQKFCLKKWIFGFFGSLEHKIIFSLEYIAENFIYNNFARNYL